MGPGIFTKYAKETTCGIVAVLLAVAFVFYWFEHRSIIGGISPYTEVNTFFQQEEIVFTVENPVYPAEDAVVKILLRNNTENTVVAQESREKNQWVLETRVDDNWHTVRTAEDYIRWAFPPEEYGPNSGPSGIVNWNGGEQWFWCDLGAYYKMPMEPGLYRIVFPGMKHTNHTNLAVEFYIEE